MSCRWSNFILHRKMEHLADEFIHIIGTLASETLEIFTAATTAVMASPEENCFDGTVEASSRVIAAFRAIETKEPDALLNDPLAQYLAGSAALAQVQTTLQPCTNGEKTNSMRKYKANRLCFRARWFDDQISAILKFARPALQQVVLLGAGMDSRAWRLDALQGVTWYELDRPGVLHAKLQMLAPAGAEMPLDPLLTCQNGAQPVVSAPPKSAVKEGETHRFPFKCKSWRGVEHDLTDPSWIKTLQQAGFNPNTPTLWIAEGLILYLEQDKADAVLLSISEHSAPGSNFVVGLVTNDSIETFQQSRYQDNALVKEFRSGVPTDAAPYFNTLHWKIVKELGYVGITLPYRNDAMEVNLASAHQLDVDQADLERFFRFFVLIKSTA